MVRSQQLKALCPATGVAKTGAYTLIALSILTIVVYQVLMTDNVAIAVYTIGTWLHGAHTPIWIIPIVIGLGIILYSIVAYSFMGGPWKALSDERKRM